MRDQKAHWDSIHTQGDIQNYSNSPTDFALEVLSLLKPKSKILELGCGAGNDSIAFAEARHEVWATDFSEVAVEKDKERFNNAPNLTFEVLDMAQSFHFQENTFDAVYARLSLHYFKNDITKRIFEDIYKVLKPQGLLFFMCKSTNDSLYGKGEEIEKDMFEYKGHVRHFFSEQYAIECLDQFKVVKLEEKTDNLYGMSSSFIEGIAEKL